MEDWFKMKRLIGLIIVIGLIVVFTLSYAQSPSSESLYQAKELFSFSETPGGLALLITRREVTLYQENPQELFLPLVVVNRTGREVVKLKEITISDTSAKAGAKLSLDFDLKDVSDIAPTRDDILSTLIEHDTEKHKELLRRSYLEGVRVSLEGLSLRDGDSLKLSTIATLEVGKNTFTTTVNTLVTIASLPVRTGWQGGDGHVHTTWSDGGAGNTILARANHAKNNGQRWIAITDHEDGIRTKGWQAYVSECNSAQSSTGIPVLPGVEITTVLTQGDPNSTPQGDALGYCLSLTQTTIPQNKQHTPQNLINAINAHNTPNSYTVIAHPYKGGNLSWKNWNVTGFRVMELLSWEIRASTSTINKWFELLRAGLNSTIAGGGFVVGIGCTDAHHISAPGDRGFSWVYAPNYTPTDRNAIWSAIRMGRVSASGRKDLGVFSLNGFAQGSVVQVTGSNTLTFRLIQQPVSGRRCVGITIRDSNNTVIHTVTNPTATETIWTIPAPANDTFYLVRFVFTTPHPEHGYDTDHSDVWTNPIFVDRI